MNSNQSSITLGLQGGGAHGAFTWGVLDRLLEEPHFNIEAISGASAGAMNAVALAHGMTVGGPEQARETLNVFWERLIVKAGHKSIAGRSVNKVEQNSSVSMLLTMGWFLSPYQFNPLAINPLRELVEELFDFEMLQRQSAIKLFIATTQVRTGRIRIFGESELTADALLASACLPSIHHAVEIEGEQYWDGAYSGNPPLFPLIHDCDSRDLLLVLLTPLQRENTPYTAHEIRNRSHEVSFNAAFLREMRSIADAKFNLDKQLLKIGRRERRLAGLRVHMIEADDFFNGLTPESKYNTEPEFLHALRDAGREHAERWLEHKLPHVGHRSSINLVELFGEQA